MKEGAQHRFSCSVQFPEHRTLENLRFLSALLGEFQGDLIKRLVEEDIKKLGLKLGPELEKNFLG